MAYPYVCKPCLDDDHEHCEERKDTPPPGSEICGGGFCVCTHVLPRGKFEQSVWEKCK